MWSLDPVVRDYIGPSALPDEWHPCHVIGAEGDALVSYAGVVWRDIAHAGLAFRIYGLSSVFTFPALRRRGYGTEVVRRGPRISGEQAMPTCLSVHDARYGAVLRTEWLTGAAGDGVLPRRTSPGATVGVVCAGCAGKKGRPIQASPAGAP